MPRALSAYADRFVERRGGGVVRFGIFLAFMEIQYWNRSHGDPASTSMDLRTFHVPGEWTMTDQSAIDDGGWLWVAPLLTLGWGWMQAESSERMGILTRTCLQHLIPRSILDGGFHDVIRPMPGRVFRCGDALARRVMISHRGGSCSWFRRFTPSTNSSFHR
ncbi:hypothetical protein R1flu_005095 [Riccia fluitans]|uniref:Uncharacterized protein n=1 Tax=Riccia fluitans TaxID=41844 RepID=A0ABD1YS66_9MARC